MKTFPIVSILFWTFISDSAQYQFQHLDQDTDANITLMQTAMKDLLSHDGAMNLSRDSIQPLITGGFEVPIGFEPYMSGMRYSAGGRSFCGGSLISSTHILTAAHCGNIPYVSIGTHYGKGTSDGEQIKVIKRHVHPQYRSVSNQYDFAVLELERPSKYSPVKVAKADDSDLVVDSMALTLGWGKTSNGTLSNVLRGVFVRLIARSECLKKFKFHESLLCAGGELNQDPSPGDSGGPLLGVGDTVLIGVVSAGLGPKNPKLYGRVSKARPWLDSIVPGLSQR